MSWSASSTTEEGRHATQKQAMQAQVPNSGRVGRLQFQPTIRLVGIRLLSPPFPYYLLDIQ
jgi:hypothetical protein